MGCRRSGSSACSTPIPRTTTPGVDEQQETQCKNAFILAEELIRDITVRLYFQAVLAKYDDFSLPKCHQEREKREGDCPKTCGDIEKNI